MKLTFHGAAKDVTGSCFLLNANGKNILIDCGMKQGCGDCENEDFGFFPSEIDHVLLTHAHIDHSGRLPLLVKNGYKGSIITTGATCELLGIMLRDSAKIQELDAKWENQKGLRAGREPVEPLYTISDAEEALTRLSPCTYGERIAVCEGVTAVFTDVGHLLGSSSITLEITENGKTKTIVFSGDIGNYDQPIIKDPIYIKHADYVVMESTYGDRYHEPVRDYAAELAKIFESTFIKGGNVIIPSFAIGRTQELLYFIREIKERKLVKSIPDFPVYVDSPLSIAATEIYSGDLSGYADELAEDIIQSGRNPLSFTNLHMTETTEESKRINSDTSSKVIISTSGMCEAGRIRHHLKHNLWREDSSIVFVGYQANGTLGRIILDGVKKVKLFGEEIAVNAAIYQFSGLSAHADRAGLQNWLTAMSPKPQKVFLVHGEVSSAQSFARLIEGDGYDVYIPNPGAVFDFVSERIVRTGIAPERKKKESSKYVSSAYPKLEAALKLLTYVVNKHRQAANKDIKRFAAQLEKLARKWDFQNK